MLEPLTLNRAAAGGAVFFFMNEASKSVPVVITRHYDFLLWLMPLVAKFPRSHRFVLGDRIQNQALDVLENLIEAAYSRDKRNALKQAGVGVETLRYLIRCAHDLQLLEPRRYHHASRQLDEIGRMIGGWWRSRGNETARPSV